MGTAVKKTKTEKAPALTDRERRLEGIAWLETKAGETWTTERIPDGDCCAARIQKSSRNDDGSHSYFCYRDGRAVDVVKDLDQARAACARGTRQEKRDAVLEYVRDCPGEVPPFLLLTAEERRAARKAYPHAVPSPSRVRVEAHRVVGAGVAVDRSDPSTRALLAELEAVKDAPVKAPGAGRVPRERGPAPKGVLARVREGNPKKAGSGAHGRWEALFAACAAGSTAEAYAAAGGNLDTLANAVRAGYVAVRQ
jgi:hypothetical protein